MNLDHNVETSAMTGYNIAEVFEMLTKHLYIQNNKQLEEFRDDGAAMVEDNRTSSLRIEEKPRGVNLYAPKPKKKKNCKC